jgi:dipeptidyl aminopeptidase/acylaminoacyl peptidase
VDGSLLEISPNGERVLFEMGDEIRPISTVCSTPVTGGPVTTAYTVEQRGTLNNAVEYLSDDELLVLSQDAREVHRVGAMGGKPSLVARLPEDDERAAFAVHVPRPGGQFALLTTWNQTTSSIDLARLDLESGDMTLLLENTFWPFFFDTGELGFVRDGDLWVVPFDLDRAEIIGTPEVRLTGFDGLVAPDRRGDRVVYAPSQEVDERDVIVIVDASEQIVQTLAEAPGEFARLTLSPDGRRLAYTHSDFGEPPRIWVLDMTSGLTRPITPDGEVALAPRWSPDGKLVYSRWLAADSMELMIMDAAPGAKAAPFLPRSGAGSVQQFNASHSPDGKHVLIDDTRDEAEPGIYLYEPGDGDSRRAFFASTMTEGGATFRPDGAWVAYYTNGSGRNEIYLRPFVPEQPESAPIHPVTRKGGRSPRWSADGRTLYYRGVDADEDKFFAVTIETEPALKISERRLVFSKMDELGISSIVELPDGRFIRIQSEQGTANRGPELRMILNWARGE